MRYVSTAEAAAYLGISPYTLSCLVRRPVPDELSPVVTFSGTLGSRGARYRWRFEVLDDWFTEVNRWRASRSEAAVGGSGGASAEEAASTDPSPSEPSARRSSARSRSRNPSSAAAGTNLVELADRLLSR